ncbi:hypothetical protein FQN60_001676 [Etheostoma spectabile]|uniref:Uncharacterized protein n=1 Tax=Etheostoma spectabile TaxID=54343 RepID=A0A5J5DBY1_9PERO|nr:hypothetical protein FQN60_001676 [Etheostoma spectabile]
MWSEVTARVNYPSKTALVELGDEEEEDMEDNTSKYCVSKRHRGTDFTQDPGYN